MAPLFLQPELGLFSLVLEANKHLPAVEPPAEGPEDTKDEEA
jgi:hypothetical protein